jgi:hypothetical protein
MLAQEDRSLLCGGLLLGWARFRAGLLFQLPKADNRRNAERISLFLYAVRKLFNDRVGQHFFRDALHIGLGLVSGEAIGEGEGEILALADGGDPGKAVFAESVLDGLSLGVEDRCF